MFFGEVILAARRFGLAATMSLGLSVSAQQSIQFTRPQESDPSSKANAFMPEDKLRRAPGSFNAPSSLFGSRPTASFDILPGSPRPVISPENAEQWKKFLDTKKNWTLMTPEEILGIPTPEKILGITDPNDDSKLSAEERFLRRQDRQSLVTMSNLLHRTDTYSWKNDNQFQSAFMPADQRTWVPGSLAGQVSGSPQDLKSLFKLRPDSVPGMNPKPSESAWTSPFETPELPPKPTPKELEGMERFRALMQPPDWEKAAQAGSAFSAAPAPVVDPNMQATPAFNPAGQTFAPFATAFVKPVGLAPLTPVSPPPAPQAKPDPLTQRPPWMQSSLQSGSFQQRKY